MLPWIRNYVTNNLQNTPEILSYLLRDLNAESKMWDFRPQADRFTLREMVSHLADLEEVIAMRLQRMRDESEPFLPSWDEGQAAIEGNYAARDPIQQLQLFKERRTQTVAILQSCSDTDWERIGIREGLGRLPISEQATFVLAHDSYHIRQTTEWLDAARAANVL
jgi:hypothetical protein